MLKLVILNISNRGVFGGGDVHMDKLASIYQEKFGTKITRIILPFPNKEFNALSNIVSLAKAIFLSVDEKYKNLYHNNIVIAPNPYPNYLITALKISEIVGGYPVIYFHHLSLSLRFIRRRGIFRSIMNYCLNIFSLCVCKILDVPIFLDNPDIYNLKGFDIFKDEDAPDEFISLKKSGLKKDFDLCYIGRFEKHKGAIDMIKAVKILKKNKKNVKVAIVGNINKRFKMKVSRILRANNLNENFVFFGTLDNEAKLKILFSSNIYLHLSYEEGWGMSVMDAAYAGIPIIAYNLPAYSYLKEKYNAVNVGNIERVAQVIENVLSNYSEAVSMATEAKKLVGKYNYLNIAKYQIDSYEKIINKRAKL